MRPLQRFLDTETSSGIVLLAAALVAIGWVNSPWAASYHAFWGTELSFTIGTWGISEDLQHWVNDLGMALFFFVVGLEIKRELVHGDLRSPRTALVPIACALGGMAVPAAIYLIVTAPAGSTGGWGIPMATDIAFALGVLALVGRRVPPSLRAFLLTLAIIDDLGAILVIALVYGGELALGALITATASIMGILALRRLHVRSLVPYLILAVVLWVAVYESGVHATVAGVVLGLLTPSQPFHHPSQIQQAVTEQLAASTVVDEVTDESDEGAFLEAARLSREAISPLARLERALHPWSSFVMLPLFALANAGIVLDATVLSDASQSVISYGVALGLLVGKPVGILVGAAVSVKLLGGALPRGARWTHLGGLGVLGGIGFTVSLFVTGLAFTGSDAEFAKVAILVASAVAGLSGAALLWWHGKASSPVKTSASG